MQQDMQLQVEISLHTLPNLHDIARYIGNKIRKMQDLDHPWLQKDGIEFGFSFYWWANSKAKIQVYF